MRNVVLVCLDTVRKDYFDEYAPRLRKSAGLSYEQCRAASTWSVPSHASMFTGELPSDHGVHDFQRRFDALSTDDTFLGELADHRTIGVSANVYASPAFGFDGLFETFWNVSPDQRFPDGIHVGEFGYQSDATGLGRFVDFARESLAHDHPLQSLANGAAVELDRLLGRLPLPKPFDDGAGIIARESLAAARSVDEPFFLFANFMDAHAPHRTVRGYDGELHDAPDTWSSAEFDKWDINLGGEEGLAANREHVEHFRGLYAAAVEYLDRTVSELVEDLRAATDRETTVVVTSDHGENLAYPEDGYLLGHDSSLSEGLLHVPCLVINPPGDGAGSIGRYVSHLDLGRLLVGLANDEVPDVTRDRIPAELVGSTNADPPEDEAYWTRALRCVYDGESKVVWDSLGERIEYELDFDRPGWQRESEREVDVAAYEREFFAEPIAEFRERAEREGSRTEVSDAVADRLAELGYR